MGELIRPFCITILYHNLLLFTDIFHILLQYLCYFILFCMFCNYTEFNCRSQDSAEKSTVRKGYAGSPKHHQKNIGIISSSNQAGAQKTSRRVPRGHPVAEGHGPPPGHAVGPPGPFGPPPVLPFGDILPLDRKITRTDFA